MAKHPALKSFYNSKNWKVFRLTLINERRNNCAYCKKIIADSKEIIAHHKTELTIGNVHDTNISLNPENIDIICFTCHNKEHRRFDFREKPGKRVYLVCGPPLSGKTTYVREHMSKGDMVVDIDKLYEAVTLLPAYDKPANLIGNVIGIHNQLIDNIKTRYGKWNNAWVIGGYADKYKRDKMSNNLGAEVIFCDVIKEECIIRLDRDDGRKHFKKEWISYIEKWFDSYTE